MVKVTYKTGDKVFAKVKGYPPWPARIEGDTGKKKYNVLFYGTQETGAIKPEDLCYYSKNKNNYVHKYLKRAGYEDAVRQIEDAIKKDGGDGNDDAAEDDSTNDIDMSDTSSISSASEKKTAKRKVASLPDEPVQKKTSGRPRRRSVGTTDSKDDVSEEPLPKKPRRKSNASTDNESKEDSEEMTLKKSEKSSDNGVKDEIPEENIQDQNEQESPKIDEVESKPSKMDEIEEDKSKESEDVTESETEKTEKKVSTVKNEKGEKTDSKEQSATKKDGEDSKKPKETEFVEIEDNADANLHMEEEVPMEAEKTSEKTTIKVDVVTEQMLNNNILYAEHVKKNASLYQKKPVENRQESKDQVLAVKLPSGTICGVKLHKKWPLEHRNEHERAIYDEQVAKSLLEIKDLLSSKNKAPNEIDAVIVPDIQMTSEDIKELTYGRDIELKRKRLDRLKKEADLVTWDSKIKNNLGLDKAQPDAALDFLKQFGQLEKDVDALMFKKHPHVLDTVRRLRKYVGNVKEWDMTSQDTEVFTRKAERIRSEAEKIYNKIKNIVTVSEDKATFWEGFMDIVSEFRKKCKQWSESEVLVLCAEPDSRQAFLDKMDEVVESEIEGPGENEKN